jgi:protein-tyrosine phosphatase
MGYLLMACGVACGVLAASHRGPLWALAWLGGCFLLVGWAYQRGGAGILGKAPDGSLAWHRVAVLLPYFLLTWAVWHAQRILSRERCFDEVRPGLLLGRRPLARELPRDVACVVDLTAEFPVASGVRARGHYLCVPVLDATAMEEDTLAALVPELLAARAPLYIHCAQGHGRSAMVVAALLLARGEAQDAAHAEALVRHARPGARLHSEQRALLHRMAPRLRELGARARSA